MHISIPLLKDQEGHRDVYSSMSMFFYELLNFTFFKTDDQTNICPTIIGRKRINLQNTLLLTFSRKKNYFLTVKNEY